MPKYACPRNWDKFQHYSGRRPPWIKLHADLLSDPAIMNLSGGRFKVLACFWLWYSQQEASRVPADSQWIARQLPALSQRETTKALDYLISNDFIELYDEIASTTLAPCKQSASFREQRTENRKVPPSSPNGDDPPPRKKPPPKTTHLKSDWQPSPDDIAYAKERGYDEADIRDFAADFVDYFTNGQGRGKRRVSWPRTWQTWIRNQSRYHRSKPANGQAGGNRPSDGGLVAALRSNLDQIENRHERRSAPDGRDPGLGHNGRDPKG